MYTVIYIINVYCGHSTPICSYFWHFTQTQIKLLNWSQIRTWVLEIWTAAPTFSFERHCCSNRAWSTAVVQVAWINDFPLIIEVLHDFRKAGRKRKPLRAVQPFVMDFIKETERTVAIQASTSPQTCCGEPVMIKEALSPWCSLQQNLITLSAFILPSSSETQELGHLETLSAARQAVSVSKFWSTLLPACLVSEPSQAQRNLLVALIMNLSDHRIWNPLFGSC